jgi:biopolymer transport protein ExbD
MASVGGESTGKKRGGRRSLDAPVNLIPYIDLMTTIITFLMMTAVWIQVSALDVQADSLSTEVPVETTVQPKPISIVMDENGFVVSEDGDNPQPFAKIDGNYDLKSLSSKLEQLKAQSKTLAEVQIFSADAVKYDNIVKVIDVVAGLGFAPASLKALSPS